MYIKLNIQKFYKDAVEVYQILARTSQIQYSNWLILAREA